MTKDEAVQKFQALVQKWGLVWNTAPPPHDYATMQEINKVLSSDDKRRALGLRV